MENSEDSLILQENALLNVPLQSYEKDFVFIIIADLLSRKISNLHRNDPTISEYYINIEEDGDFTYILNAVNMNKINIPDRQIPFISKIIDILENNSIKIHSQDEKVKITNENIIYLLQKHEKFPLYYDNCLIQEIDYASEHFFEIEKDQENELQRLNLNTIIQIINNPKLRLESEGQLIMFVNHLCQISDDFNSLYQYVQFSNVSTSEIDEFLSIFNPNYMSNEIWFALSQRLRKNVVNDRESTVSNNRYTQKYFPFIYEKPCDGILSYLKDKSNGDITNLVNLISQTVHPGYELNKLFDPDPNQRFCSTNTPNASFTFDFIENSVILRNYKIQSCLYATNWHHLKSWKVEGSNDNSNWDEIDSQNNCDYLNGIGLYHTFDVKKENIKPFRYIKLTSLGNDWGGQNWVSISSIEFYGSLIGNV